MSNPLHRAGLAVAELSACDAASGTTITESGSDSRQVTVVGSGQVQGTPDMLTAGVKDARARAFNDAKDRAQQYAQLSV
jgi:uncharacterized protein YggE